MQLVPNGPDIPAALLQAHEEGRVVFFCGAGISYPAGLPGFKGLVEQIYKSVATNLSDIESKAFEQEQFDATLDLLERRLPGHRRDVRCALKKALTPKLRRNGATKTHEALLRLGRSREGALRLVTTNFDRIFHKAAKRIHQSFHAYTAPMLPIPKNSRWDGLVYLHGLLPEKDDATALNRLVVTSGDFGLAYLTERWAARFVSELLRNYVVCFVGYNINDPVLRYMMDALAADRMQGEAIPQAWAFADFETGGQDQKLIEWKAKGVTPILYEVPSGSHDHSRLHQTLHTWADIYRDGILGKEAIVGKYASVHPQNSTPQDDFVGRMLWALSDKSGLPAKRFAEFNPVPPLEWLLEVFSHDHFGHDDLTRLGVQHPEHKNNSLKFSLVCRPPNLNLAPRMQLASGEFTGCDWDPVMHHLAQWLLRHMDDPRLILWIAERGGQLHKSWVNPIENELERFASLESEGNTAALEEIRRHSPKAIPSAPMRTLWRLLLCGRLKSSIYNLDLYHWRDRFRREGLTTPLRLELRELFAPKIILRRPFYRSEIANIPINNPPRVCDFVDWELALTANHVHDTLNDLRDNLWDKELPNLLDDFQSLLRDALDLRRELGGGRSQESSATRESA